MYYIVTLYNITVCLEKDLATVDTSGVGNSNNNSNSADSHDSNKSPCHGGNRKWHYNNSLSFINYCLLFICVDFQ